MLSYCIKEKKNTQNKPGSEHYERTKNNRLIMKSICASCGSQKTKFVKNKGAGLDIQNALAPLGEMHLRTFPKMKKYEYCGPGTDLKTRLKRNDQGINRLDKVCKQHDIDYDNSQNLQDKHIADQKMVDTINKFKDKSLTERAVKNIILTKKKLGLGVKKKSKN